MKAKDLTYVGIFTALIVICSWISIPSAVPFTLQTMGIFLCVGLLGGKRGILAVLVYIFLGAVGLPVFSGFKGGIGTLFGVTGGYIIGFIGSALFMWAVIYLIGDNTLGLLIGMLSGLLVCYVFGTAWFMVLYMRTKGNISLAAVLTKCVIPFIIPDLLKISAALFLTKRLKPYIKVE